MYAHTYTKDRYIYLRNIEINSMRVVDYSQTTINCMVEHNTNYTCVCVYELNIVHMNTGMYKCSCH